MAADKRKQYGREKPICNYCRKPHWRFVGCEQADRVNAVEARNEEERTRYAVIPQPRAGRGRPFFTGRNFVMQAPGVYRRARVDDA